MRHCKATARLQVSERLIDQGANPKLDGSYILAVIWSEKAPGDQRVNFSRPDLHPNDSLSTPPSRSMTAHTLGRCRAFGNFRHAYLFPKRRSRYVSRIFS